MSRGRAQTLSPDPIVTLPLPRIPCRRRPMNYHIAPERTGRKTRRLAGRLQEHNERPQLMAQPHPAAPSSRGAFIYGSCVTRDAFQLDGLPPLADYFARSPVISAFGRRPSSVPAELDLEAISSPFQRRMVKRDLEKQLPAALRNLTDEIVILDLIDERIRVAESANGMIAISPEVARVGFRGGSGRQLKIGTPAHTAAWVRAADALADALRGRTVILNQAFWATHDDAGGDLSMKFDIETHNRALREMYAHLAAALDCHTVEYSQDLLVADSQHRWGLSPFHYIDSFYTHFVERFQALNLG